MNDIYDNVTDNEHYHLYGVNITDDLYSYEDYVVNDTICEQLNEGSSLFEYYINNSQQLYDLEPTEWVTVDVITSIKLCALLLTTIGGLLGNISAILTVALNKSVRTTTNFYIVNLSIADAMTCVFGMIPQIFETMSNNVYVLGEIVCKIEDFAKFTFFISSVFTLAAISFDRFMAVVFPYRFRVTKERQSVVVTLVWTASIVLSLPFLFVHKLQVVEWKDFMERHCKEDWPERFYYHEDMDDCIGYSTSLVAYSIVLTISLYFLPIIIMITAYSFILWRLRSSKRPGEYEAAHDDARSRIRKKVIIMVFVVLLVFVISWTPFQLLAMSHIFQLYDYDYRTWRKRFRWFAWFMALSNSFINPFIYAGFNGDFRKGIYAILRCRKPVSTPKNHHGDRDTPDSTNKPQSEDSAI